MTTATPERAIATEEQIEPPYEVLIHNDDVNSMQHVVESLTHCVPALTREEAFEIMMRAHESGQARVTIAPHDQASRYRSCLESRGLTATIEPL